VEAALSKNNISMPYSSQSGTVHFLTFPTKITNTLNGCSTQRTSNSPFFAPYVSTDPNEHLCVPFTGTDYDLSENSRISSNIFSPAPTGDRVCGEVNYINGFPYSEGWALYDFSVANNQFTPSTDFPTRESEFATGINDGNYTGVPVIGTVINLGSDGLWGLNAAYTDGRVQTTAAAVSSPASRIYYYYQYQDESNTGYLYDSDISPDDTRLDDITTTPAHPLYDDSLYDEGGTAPGRDRR
jgi:hypothetical protein